MERAAGFVLFNGRGGQREYLIVKNRRGGHWGFPKGHIEPGETPEKAARREVFEEVSITNIRLIPDFQERIFYRFSRRGEMVGKEVMFLLGETDEDGNPDLKEISAMRWLPYPEALRLITFLDQRELLNRAEAFLARLEGLAA